VFFSIVSTVYVNVVTSTRRKNYSLFNILGNETQQLLKTHLKNNLVKFAGSMSRTMMPSVFVF
jgi:hypothetical protein